MKISVSKRILRAGDIQEVTWENYGGSNQNLVIYTGREVSMTVPVSGSKKLRMKGGNILNWMAIRTNEYGKVYTKRRYFLVFGKKKETDSFEYMGGSSPLQGRMGNLTKWLSRWWGMYTPEKKRLYTIVLLLFIYQLILPSHPDLASSFLTACIFYIFWIIIRK